MRTQVKILLSAVPFLFGISASAANKCQQVFGPAIRGDMRVVRNTFGELSIPGAQYLVTEKSAYVLDQDARISVIKSSRGGTKLTPSFRITATELVPLEKQGPYIRGSVSQKDFAFSSGGIFYPAGLILRFPEGLGPQDFYVNSGLEKFSVDKGEVRGRAIFVVNRGDKVDLFQPYRDKVVEHDGVAVGPLLHLKTVDLPLENLARVSVAADGKNVLIWSKNGIATTDLEQLVNSGGSAKIDLSFLPDDGLLKLNPKDTKFHLEDNYLAIADTYSYKSYVKRGNSWLPLYRLSTRQPRTPKDTAGILLSDSVVEHTHAVAIDRKSNAVYTLRSVRSRNGNAGSYIEQIDPKTDTVVSQTFIAGLSPGAVSVFDVQTDGTLFIGTDTGYLVLR